MTKIKQAPRKILTPEEKEQVKELEKECDIILDSIFDHITDDNRQKINRLNWIEKRILDIKGESPLDVNSDFRR